MTRLRLTATLAVAPAAPVVACIGDGPDGIPHAWFTAGEGQIQPGVESEVPEDRLFPCRAGASAKEMLGLLCHWPAWRVTQLAQIELGSRLLVVGEGWLARRVLEFAWLWGCLWRVACGPADLRQSADFWIERTDVQTLRKILPGKPDAVIILGGQREQIAPALAACQDKGSVVLAVWEGAAAELNLYPDVHRRSLRVVGCAPVDRRAISDEDVGRGFARIAALIAAGALARP